MCICNEYIMYMLYVYVLYVHIYVCMCMCVYIFLLFDPTILVLKIHLERKSEMGQEFSFTMCGLVRETNHQSHDAAKW